MSHFSKELQIGTFDKRKLELTPLNRIMEVREDLNEVVRNTSMDVLTGYHVSAKFALKAYVRDKEEMAFIFPKAKRQMIYALFGEFKEPIHRLREALWDRDFVLATSILDKLEEEMFT